MDKKEGLNTINFLLNRWKKVSQNAAIERAILENIKFAKQNNFPVEQMPETLQTIKPIMHINMIKKRIIEIEPELEWILTDFNPSMELNTDTFIELYISYQGIVINKIRELMRSKKVDSRRNN